MNVVAGRGLRHQAAFGAVVLYFTRRYNEMNYLERLHHPQFTRFKDPWSSQLCWCLWKGAASRRGQLGRARRAVGTDLQPLSGEVTEYSNAYSCKQSFTDTVKNIDTAMKSYDNAHTCGLVNDNGH